MSTKVFQLAAQRRSSATEKTLISPSDLTDHGRETTVWLAAYLPYHAPGITPHRVLAALFPCCSCRVSTHGRGSCVGKDGGFYFKEQKFPCLWLWDLSTENLLGSTTDAILSVKRGRGDESWTLPSLPSDSSPVTDLQWAGQLHPHWPGYHLTIMLAHLLA